MTFRDDLNNFYTRRSGAVTVTSSRNTPATGNPQITGNVTELGIAASNSGNIRDADGISGPPGSQFSVQWLLDGSPIAGAVGQSLTIPDNTEGQSLSVRYSFIDSQGNAESRVSSARTIGARTNTPRASLTVLEQDVTATVAIAALNPTEWNDNDSITIRRRIGVRTTALWPTDGQSVRYRDFTPPTFPSITPTYNAQLSRLTAGTNYTIELWVNGIAVATAKFTTKAPQSAILTRVFRVGADWENIIASAVTSGADSRHRLLWAATPVSGRGQRYSTTTAVTGNQTSFAFFGLTPCTNYRIQATLIEVGGSAVSGPLGFEHKLRQLTQRDINDVNNIRLALIDAKTSADRISTLLTRAIAAAESARDRFQLSRSQSTAPFNAFDNLRRGQLDLEQVQSILMDVEAETIKLNTSLSSVVVFSRASQSAVTFGNLALAGSVGVAGASLLGVGILGALGLANAVGGSLITATFGSTILGWGAGISIGGTFFAIGTGPTLWAAPALSTLGGTASITVGLGTALFAIGAVIAVVVVPAVLIDRITDAADRAKDYTESDRQDIGGNRAGLIFDLRTVQGNFSQSGTSPTALQTSIDNLNTVLAGMRFQRDRTDCG